MPIRHERPSSLLSHRVSAPLTLLTTRGDTVNFSHWSLDGLVMPMGLDIAPQGGDLYIPFQGVDISFPVTLKQDGDVLRFKGLNGREREVLALFHEGLLTGQMATGKRMITSLDTPVDLVPMDRSEEETPRPRGRTVSAALRVLCYGLVALALLSFAGPQIWTRISTLPVSSARIVAPIELLYARGDSHVERILVEEGQTVRQGDPILRLEDPRREADLDRVRAEINELEDRLADLDRKGQRLLADHRLRIREASAALDRAARSMRLSDLLGGYDLWRLDALFAERRQLINLREDQILGPILDDKVRLNEELRRLRRDRGNMRSHAEALIVRAPTDGVVTALHVYRDQPVHRGFHVVTMERDEDRLIKAVLADRLAPHVEDGQLARIYLPGATKPALAQVAAITAEDRDLRDAGGMVVSFRVIPEEGEAASPLAEMRDGVPVAVRLSRWITAQ